MNGNIDSDIKNIISVIKEFTDDYELYDSRKVDVKAYHDGEYKYFVCVTFKKAGNKKLITKLKDMGFNVENYITYKDDKSYYVSKISLYQKP